MCNQVQTVTLQIAILQTVKEFAGQNQSFSAHDITRELRKKCANGELEIPEVEVNGSSFRFEIPHVKVNTMFKDMYNAGAFNPDFTLSRCSDPTGRYFIYTPQSVSGVSYATTTTATAPTVPPITSTGLLTRADVSNRVKLYLNNCDARGFRPTLKQVQSAIKRSNVSTGWSCNDLWDLIEHDLGYKVIGDGDFMSQFQVATV